MLINTTDYHLFPVVDNDEPEGLRPVRGYVAVTVAYSPAADGVRVVDVRFSFLDSDHNTYNSISVELLPMFVSAAKLVVAEMEYPIDDEEWNVRGGIIPVASE